MSIVADVERPRPESELSLLRLLMAGIALVLLVYAAAFLVVIEFVYRHLIGAPLAWLLTCLAGLAPHKAPPREPNHDTFPSQS